MAWIESHQELARHPKTKRLSRKLGVNIPTAIGHLHMLWWWALDYAQDGNISAYEAEDIAEAIDWPYETACQLLEALIDARFIDNTEQGLILHDWFDYAGRLMDRREQNKERKRKSRAKKADKEESHTPVTRDGDVTLSDGLDGHGATEQNLTEPNHTEPLTEQNKNNNNNHNMNPFRLFESEGFGTLSLIIGQKLGDMVDTYGERWVCEAMKAAVYQGKRNLPYVNRILESYKNSGIDEPWTQVKSSPPKDSKQRGNRGISYSGKPNLPIASGENKGSSELSDEKLREMCVLARKLDRQPPPSEEDVAAFIANHRGQLQSVS